MGENRFLKKLLQYKLTGTWDVGRPRSQQKNHFALLDSEHPIHVKEDEEK
jgi:hypothetical protein